MYATAVGLVLFGLEKEEHATQSQPEKEDESDDPLDIFASMTGSPMPADTVQQPVSPEPHTSSGERRITPDPDPGRGFRKLSRYLTNFFTEGQDTDRSDA